MTLGDIFYAIMNEQKLNGYVNWEDWADVKVELFVGPLSPLLGIVVDDKRIMLNTKGERVQ
jgi:hypothetical protein